MSEIINSKIFKITYDGYDKFYVCGTLNDRNAYMNGFYKKYIAHIKGQTSNKMVMFPIFDKILLDCKDKAIIDIINKIDIKDDSNKIVGDALNEDNEDNENNESDDEHNEDDEQNEQSEVADNKKKKEYKLTTDEIKVVLKVLRANIKLVDIKINIVINNNNELKKIHQKCINELKKTGKCLNINDVFNSKKVNSYDNSKVVKIYSETDKKIIFIGSTTQKMNIYFNSYLRKFNNFENGKGEIDSDVFKVFRAGNAKYEILFEGKLPDRNALLLKTQEFIDKYKDKCVNSGNAVQDKDYQHNYSIENAERKKEYREKKKQEKQ